MRYESHASCTFFPLFAIFQNPEIKKFEFMHLKVCARDSWSVEELLEIIPRFALSPTFAKETYHSLYRTMFFGGKRLDNTRMIHRCQLENNEVLLPVIANNCEQDLLRAADPLLQNERVMAMVSSIYVVLPKYIGFIVHFVSNQLSTRLYCR